MEFAAVTNLSAGIPVLTTESHAADGPVNPWTTTATSRSRPRGACRGEPDPESASETARHRWLQHVRGDLLPALVDRITHHQAVRVARRSRPRAGLGGRAGLFRQSRHPLADHRSRPGQRGALRAHGIRFRRLLRGCLQNYCAGYFAPVRFSKCSCIAHTLRFLRSAVRKLPALATFCKHPLNRPTDISGPDQRLASMEVAAHCAACDRTRSVPAVR